jgi:hypothetical protein
VADAHRDFDRAGSGLQPDETALATAPIVENWHFALVSRGAQARQFLALTGDVTGHPRYPGISIMHTSALMSVDFRKRWARTANRFYRLGQPRDEKVSLAETLTQGTSSQDRQLLERYVSAFDALPKPTPDQLRAFPKYVSSAHSWYKHLPLLPPGVPFNFYLDPGAGMQRTITSDGSVQIAVRKERGFHYSWNPH